jgi:hypothetical protein
MSLAEMAMSDLMPDTSNERLNRLSKLCEKPSEILNQKQQ